MSRKMVPLSGEELSQQLAPITRHLPDPKRSEAPLINEVAPKQERRWPVETVQINFRASKHLASIIAESGQKNGSVRRFIAKLLKEQGYDILDDDLNPVDFRRRP